MSSERSGNERYKSKNSPLQEHGGQKKWSSRGELSTRSATLEYPSKNSKTGSLSDDEDERNNSKKKRKLFAFSSKSKRERNGSGDVRKKTKNKDESSKDGHKQRASRSNTISELSVTQLQKRLSREVKPIFEVELEEAVERSKSLDGIELPLIIRECIDHIEAFGLDTPGIYRVSGIKSKIETLKIAYNSGRSVDLKEFDITVVTGLLKLFLRELPDPVLTQDLNSKFEEAAAVPNDELRLEEFQGVLKELPSCNYALLSWIIVHLSHVLEHADVNKMSIQNLTIVFSPTMRISHRVLYHLFTNWQTFFGHIKLKKCKKPLQLDQAGQVQLPEEIEELQEELQFHESFLNKMHEDLNKGVASHGTEEELWEVQRIVTMMKRKLRKALSAQKQAKQQQEDEQSDSVDQKSTDSKLDDGSSTGTDENRLTEDGGKDTQEEESPREEVKTVTAVYENVTLKERVEEKPVSPEEVTVEIQEDEKVVTLTEKEESKEEEEDVKEKEEEEAAEDEELEEEEEESLESLFLFYSELTAKQEELTKIRLELQRRIEMEQSEVARLKAEIEAAKAEPKMRASTSSSVDLSDNSSSDSEEEEELQAILKKLREDNERLKKDNEESSFQIHNTREECADLKAKINVEKRRSEIIRDIQDELEKDKAKKKKRKKRDKEERRAEKDAKGDGKTREAPSEGSGAFSPGVSEC